MSAEARENEQHLCRLCQKRGRVELLRDDGSVIFAAPYCFECSSALHDEYEERDREATIEKLLRISGIPDNMSDWSIETRPRDVSTRTAYTNAGKWLAEYREGVRRNLYVWGDVGTGKSGLAVSVTRKLCEEQIGGYFVIWRDLLQDIRATFSEDEPLPPAEERAAHAAVLVLDDLGAERATPFALERLASLVQRRMDGRRPVVVTSNYSPEALHRYFGGDLISSRIIDRLVDEAAIIEMTGPSRRRSIFGRRGAA